MEIAATSGQNKRARPALPPSELRPDSTTAFPNVVKERGGKGVPRKTFKDKLTFGIGNDRVDLFYFGRGHTGGDAWVVFPSLRVLHTGDMFPDKRHSRRPQMG